MLGGPDLEGFFGRNSVNPRDPVKELTMKKSRKMEEAVQEVDYLIVWPLFIFSAQQPNGIEDPWAWVQQESDHYTTSPAQDGL